MLQFIAFGVNRGGAALYPRLLDLDATAGNNTAGINSAIAYMQFHFKGVGALPLRMDGPWHKVTKVHSQRKHLNSIVVL